MLKDIEFANPDFFWLLLLLPLAILWYFFKSNEQIIEQIMEKSYESILSRGTHKLCECRVCKTLEYKIMIAKDRNCEDYEELHKGYI